MKKKNKVKVNNIHIGDLIIRWWDDVHKKELVLIVDKTDKFIFLHYFNFEQTIKLSINQLDDYYEKLNE